MSYKINIVARSIIISLLVGVFFLASPAVAEEADVHFSPLPSLTLQTQAVTEETTKANTTSNRIPSYLLSSKNHTEDFELFWPGFLTGMTAFKNFAEPIGNPLFFESPFINTQLKLLYLWHDFPKQGQIGGGEVNIIAAQIRVALTDRLALIATKDGYSSFNAGILPQADGFNDFALGLKYAFLVDEANQFVMTGGMRWELHNGDADVLQGGDSGANELSPFVSFAKGWDRFHVIGTVNGRLPMDRNDGNFIVNWDLHFDYEAWPEQLPGFFPLLEIHALHYLTNGNRFPTSFGGLDYTNLGASDVAGSSVFWGDLGFRWKLTPHTEFGAAYGFPISNPSNDIFNQRVTVDFIFNF